MARGFDFGDTWVDVDGNGCDTRNDILRRDLSGEVMNDSCEVASGNLANPYTGQKLKFTRGRSTSANVPIDHVIPLHLAWELGAYKWQAGKRVAFANDPANLLATDRASNSAKSDQGPDTWLPANSKYRCTYVMRFTRVAYLYKLSLTSAIKKAISSQLGSCKVVVGAPTLLTPLAPSLWANAAHWAG